MSAARCSTRSLHSRILGRRPFTAALILASVILTTIGANPTFASDPRRELQLAHGRLMAIAGDVHRLEQQIDLDRRTLHPLRARVVSMRSRLDSVETRSTFELDRRFLGVKTRIRRALNRMANLQRSSKRTERRIDALKEEVVR